jgi:methylase of polypeptide subunit release factors
MIASVRKEDKLQFITARADSKADLQYHIFTLTFDGKLSTVINKEQKIHRVLDVGTGTGIWAIDFGLYYPISGAQFEWLTLSSR